MPPTQHHLSARSPDVLVHHDEWILPTTEEPFDFAHGDGLEISIGMSMSPRVVPVVGFWRIHTRDTSGEGRERYVIISRDN